jgi:hypothetical protein
MTKQISFTKAEHKVLPGFRQKINHAESTEDVKKFFVQTFKDLFEDVFGGEMKFRYEDFNLRLDRAPHYTLSDRVLSSKNIKSVWKESDLSRVIARLAESAMHRYKHLENNPQKSENKIRL